MKRTLLALLVVAAALPLAAQDAAPAAPAADAGSRPVATLNGETITAAQLDALYSHIPGKTRDQYEQNGGKMAFLDNYLRKRLIVQEAVKHNFDKEPDVAAELNQARDAALFDRYIRDTVARQVITDEIVRKFYDDNVKGFAYPETVKVRHIIATGNAGPVTNSTGSKARNKEEAMQKIISIRAELFAQQKQIHGDETPEKRAALVNAFARAADKYSEDATAGSGGDLGWVGPGKLEPTFEDAAFHLEPGQISGVIQTKFGYHLIMVEERRPAGTATFDEVKARIREELTSQYAKDIVEAVTRLTNELRAQSKLSLYPENVR